MFNWLRQLLEKPEIDFPDVRKTIIYFLDDQEKGIWNSQFVGNITFPTMNIVKIHTTRPGLLIGKGGKNIDTFSEKVKKAHPFIKEVHLQEISLWGKTKRV